ncbi:MAG: glycosyltransferase [Candidatus Woesebacteria bacterium]|nr:glycosyltransferase [Candidatus Woesebacteria bacterium]
MKISAHMIVKNEENFIWYVVNSVISYVDKIMIWDQGSTDKTIEIIKTINNPKIIFKKASEDVGTIRQRMLDETNGDWIFILDGDEIWYEQTIKNLQFTIYNLQNKKDLIVVPNHMLIGDIFHYQEKAAGKYKICGKVGHYNIRAVRKIDGLHVEGIYPNEAYVTKEGVKVQDLNKERILFLETPYLHASFLKRSSKDVRKVKHEIGKSFSKDFYYPEVFFEERPSIVPSPWKTMSGGYRLRALLETPLKKIKRRII